MNYWSMPVSRSPLETKPPFSQPAQSHAGHGSRKQRHMWFLAAQISRTTQQKPTTETLLTQPCEPISRAIGPAAAGYLPHPAPGVPSGAANGHEPDTSDKYCHLRGRGLRRSTSCRSGHPSRAFWGFYSPPPHYMLLQLSVWGMPRVRSTAAPGTIWYRGTAFPTGPPPICLQACGGGPAFIYLSWLQYPCLFSLSCVRFLAGKAVLADALTPGQSVRESHSRHIRNLKRTRIATHCSVLVGGRGVD